MFGWKLIKEKELNKIKYDKDYYFHRCQEAEDKNFELEEEVYELNKYVRDLHNKIFEKSPLINVANDIYDLKVDISENKEKIEFKTLRIDLVPIHNSVEFMNLELDNLINEKMLEHLSERISEVFFNNIKKELLRNFGYEY